MVFKSVEVFGFLDFYGFNHRPVVARIQLICKIEIIADVS
jgi:hypothetical protein